MSVRTDIRYDHAQQRRTLPHCPRRRTDRTCWQLALGRAVAKPGALERGHVRVKLVRELAKGEKSHRELAEQFDVSAQAVDRFAKRHAARIAEVAGKLDDQFAGIAFADKVNRVAMLSQQIEDVTEILADPETAARAGVQYAEMARTAQSAARAISEELGQLPARTVRHEGGVSVRYEVAGVDPEVLR